MQKKRLVIFVILNFCRLARIKLQSGNFQTAEHYYRENLPILIEKIGISHPDVITVAGRYLETLTKLNRREEIEKLLVQFPSLRQ